MYFLVCVYRILASLVACSYYACLLLTIRELLPLARTMLELFQAPCRQSFLVNVAGL